MKIGIYSPYFDTTGGGERYMFAVAAHLSGSHDVRLFWDSPDIIQRAAEKFLIDLSKTKVVRNIFRRGNILNKLLETRKYDLIILLSDGSIPWSLARYNIVHFQMPFSQLPYNALKMSRFRAVVVNSRFTKDHLDTRFGNDATVIYPPVNTADFSPKTPKKNQILHIGRFTTAANVKKQKLLVQAFKDLHSIKIAEKWSLVMAGSVLPDDMDSVDELRALTKGMPVSIETDIPFSRMKELYETSRIYWHAAGYRETDPLRFEHFGISTVEAMAAGAVPVVFGGGGLTEIIRDGRDGLLWQTPDELTERTAGLIRNTSECTALSKRAVTRAKEFDTGVFNRRFDELIASLS